MCWARRTESHTYLNLYSRKFPSSLEVPIHSAVQNCQSLDSEDFNGTLNKSRHWATYKIASFQLKFSPILISLLHFPCGISLSLLGSASYRVPTPLNSDVTSSLPVARVKPITNILHFSLVSSAMWNAARGPNCPSILPDTERHQALSLSYFVNYLRLRFCAGRL
jgi:hypothetical protein